MNARREPIASGGGVRHSTAVMFAYHEVVFSGSAANAGPPLRGLGIVRSQRTSTAMVPVAERIQQGFDGRFRDDFAACLRDGDRRPHLLEVDRASGTRGDVLLEPPGVLARQRALQIVGDELDK